MFFKETIRDYGGGHRVLWQAEKSTSSSLEILVMGLLIKLAVSFSPSLS
jgi:hypothetical protein